MDRRAPQRGADDNQEGWEGHLLRLHAGSAAAGSAAPRPPRRATGATAAFAGGARRSIAAACGPAEGAVTRARPVLSRWRAGRCCTKTTEFKVQGARPRRPRPRRWPRRRAVPGRRCRASRCRPGLQVARPSARPHSSSDHNVPAGVAEQCRGMAANLPSSNFSPSFSTAMHLGRKSRAARSPWKDGTAALGGTTFPHRQGLELIPSPPWPFTNATVLSTLQCRCGKGGTGNTAGRRSTPLQVSLDPGPRPGRPGLKRVEGGRGEDSCP